MSHRRMTLLTAAVVLSLCLGGCGQNHYKQGMKALETGEYETAAEQFDASVKEEKHVADSLRGLGLALWETKDYEGSRDALLQSLDAGAERTATVLNLLGSCELALGNAAEAAQYFEEGLEDGSLSAELAQEMRFNTIAAYEALGDMDTAGELLKEYVEKYPEDEEAAHEAEFLQTRQRQAGIIYHTAVICSDQAEALAAEAVRK